MVIKEKLYVNAIVGWQFPETTILKYLPNKEKPLLTMDFDYPSQNKCNLRCKYCFIEEDSREKGALLNKTAKISLGQLKKVFKAAKELGLKSAKLVGDQESLLERDFLDFIDFMDDLGIWVVVFTNGAVLANDNACKKLHRGLDSYQFIEYLKKKRVSVMLKFHSFNNAIEDELVGVKGYALKRNLVLDKFLASGFNRIDSYPFQEHLSDLIDEQRGWARLGLESVITPQCVDDVIDIYKLKIEKDIYIDLDPPVAVGLTRDKKTRQRLGIDVDPEVLLELNKKIYEINLEYGIEYKGPSPYFGGLPCSQLPYGLYVNSIGHLYPCCGAPEVSGGVSQFLGGIENKNENEIRTILYHAIMNSPFKKSMLEKGFAYDKFPFNIKNGTFQIYHGCPFRDNEGDILPENWMETLHNHIIKKINENEEEHKDETEVLQEKN